jgi:peptidyl-prolyl cis-trans isomerase C
MTFIHRISGRYFLFPLFGLLLGIVSGCSDTDKGDPATNIAAIGKEHLTQADFDAYLRIKRIPIGNKNRVERARKTFLERNALAQVIAKQSAINSTELNAELREFRNELLTSRYFEAFLDKAVDDETVKKFYEDHKAEYQLKELNLAEILFRVRPQMTEQQSAEVFKKAVKVHQDLKKGSNFSSAVKKHSDDYGSKRHGGKIGWVRQGQIDPALFAEAAKLKKSEVSQPIRANLGYYIVKMLDDPKVTQRPFDSVKGQISYQLRNEAKQKEMARLMSQINVTELE